jgi:hypothetical protein
MNNFTVAVYIDNDPVITRSGPPLIMLLSPGRTEFVVKGVQATRP